MNKEPIYIVDWDIPVEHRHAFYAKLRRLRRRLGLYGSFSTMSVFKTRDKRLAWLIHRIALQYGRSNIYIAYQLNGYE